MAELLFDNQAPSSTPAAGQSRLYPDNVGKRWSGKDDGGVISTLSDIENGSSAAVAAAYAADTYLAGSSILIPRGLVKANTRYRCLFDMVKTAAGVAAFTVNVRFGINGNIADAARVAFAFAIGTGAIDTGLFEVSVHFRNVGAAAVLAGACECRHHLAATGLITTGAAGVGIILANSAGFDSTVLDSFIGLSVNGGAAFSGTNTFVHSQLNNA